MEFGQQKGVSLTRIYQIKMCLCVDVTILRILVF